MPYVPAADRPELDPAILELSAAIAQVAAKHKYEGAFAGELNYVLTRLLQQLPRDLVKENVIKEEIRYWIQPTMYGVLLDVALEHKRRVNTAYEAAQIVKSGDCYDAPYYTKLVEIIDEATGVVVGHTEIMLKRSPETVGKDIVGQMKLVVKQ